MTYIGAVSYMKLVSTTDTWTSSGKSLSKDLGASRRRNAVSMLANLSPRFEPSARATECNDKDGPLLSASASVLDVGRDGAKTSGKSPRRRVIWTWAEDARANAFGFDSLSVTLSSGFFVYPRTCCATAEASASTVRYAEGANVCSPFVR